MVFVLLVLCLVMAGCGAVGDPLPPLVDIPQVSNGLAAVQRGNQVLLTWPAPTLTTEGVAPRPARLGSVHVYRAVLPDLRKDKPTAADFKGAAEIAQVESGKTGYNDPVVPAWSGHTVVYAITMTNARGESAGLSNFAPATVLTVGPAPEIPSAVTTAEAVKVSWSAARGSMYRVYRDGAALGDVSVGDVAGGEFEDKAFEFDHPYSYTVRALAKQGEFFAESEDSPPRPITPQDTFPPEPPQGVRALSIEGAVDLSWSPNNEADLAGYNVYRGTRKLNDAPIVNTVFRDTSPAASPGKYHVTAIDTHRNESKPSEEVVP